MKNFSKWKLEEVEEVFQLSPVEDLDALNVWLKAETAISPAEDARLMELCYKLRAHVHDWNEEELKIKFIGFVLNLVDYDQEQYQAFFERQLSVTIDGKRLSGVVDCIIAKGKRSPRHPVFCLHEYKPERYASDDPLGQVLVAMVAAQKRNNNDAPVYGAYITGRFWNFLVLDGSRYAVSLACDATKEDDLRQIFVLLHYIKQQIEAMLQK